MIEVSDMPTINAGLNATSALFLIAGYVAIRMRRITAHLACMVAAFVCSAVFLAGYLVYHYQVGHVVFTGSGLVRGVYLAILGSHVLLAIAVLPMSLTTLYRAYRRQFDRHSRVARWTLPIWLYVSVTGVVVYLMLYGLPA